MEIKQVTVLVEGRGTDTLPIRVINRRTGEEYTYFPTEDGEESK